MNRPLARHPLARVLAAAIALNLTGFYAFAGDDKNPKKDPDAIGNRDVGSGINFYSLEKEIALGKQLAQEVERQAKIIDDPVIAEYVNRVGQNIVRNSDAKVPFTIKVLDTEEVNAFALPGGFFFVNSGPDSEGRYRSRTGGRDGARNRARGMPARNEAGDARRSDADRRHCGLHRSGRLDRLRDPAGHGSGDSDGHAAVLAAVRAVRPTTTACNTCTRPDTIPRPSWTSSKKSRRWKRRSRDRSPRCSPRIPMTDARIKKAQEEIQTILKPKPEYVVTTSEFNDVKARLAMMHNHRLVDKNQDPSRPTLRRNTGNGTGPVDSTSPSGTSTDDDRPTLKRRDSGSGSGGNGNGNGNGNNQ